MISAHSMDRMRSRIQLLSLTGDVEDIVRQRAFGVDERDLDAAIFAGQRRTDGVQQAWAILGHHLQQRAAGRSLVVVAQRVSTVSFTGADRPSGATPAKVRRRRSPHQDLAHRSLEALARSGGFSSSVRKRSLK